MADTIDRFTGFSHEGLDFLAALGERDKAWFDDNRPTYNAEVANSAKAFVVAVGEALQSRISPAIEAQPKTNGSIAPINNDLRFNPEASPYKDHLMFRFWEGPNKKTSAMLMLRLHPVDGVGFASGMNFRDLDAWRSAVASDDSGPQLADAIAAVVADTGADVVGQDLKRVPKPYAQDHPRSDLLRHKSLQVRYIDPADRSLLTGPQLVDWCVDRLVRLADIHAWLVRHLV